MERRKIGTIFIILIIIAFNFLFCHINSDRVTQKNSQIEPNGPEAVLVPKIFAWDSPITRNVGDKPLSIAMGDVNNDGELDIVTANNNSDSISILLWNITAGDWVAHNRSVGSGPCAVAVGDANNDGFFDIVAANNHSNEITILLWNYTFQDWNSSSQVVGNQPCAVCIEDANNDGLNEIVVTNYADDTVSIFTYNLSYRNWNPEITVNVGDGPIAVGIGDANNDGLNEIVTANRMDSEVSILQWNETDTIWNPAINKSVGNSPSALAIGDGNNDGKIDILTANSNDNSVTILQWNTTAEDWDTITKPVGNQPSSIAVGDVNSDGQNDLVAANYGDANISILSWNAIDENWDLTTKSVNIGPTSVIIGDLSNNGLMDIATANSLANTVSILPWNTTRGDLAPQRIIRSVQTYPSDVAIGDANNDGEIDIVAATLNDKNVSVLCWNETLNDWNPELTLNVSFIPTSVYIGDANNDGAQDIVACCSTISYTNVSIILWNDTKNYWDPYTTRNISDFSGWDVIVADANNDGANDIVVANKWQAKFSLLLWNKTQKNWNPLINRTLNGVPYQIEVADVNNDGFNDLVAAGNFSTTASVWIRLWNSSKGEWDDDSSITISTSLPQFTPALAVGDANNDGRNDLVLTDKNGDNVVILCWNDTLETWNSPINNSVEEDPISVDIGDVNNDGQNDIITSNEVTGKVSVLLWNANTSDWDPRIDYAAGNDPRSVITGDVTGDGMHDITVANFQDATISVLMFNRYPWISSRASIQSDPVWVQNEDFGSFSINFTGFETDADEEKINLTWGISVLDLNRLQSFVTVSGSFSSNDTLTFYSVENTSGTDTFWLRLKDRHGMQDMIQINITVNPVNDIPIILSKEEIQNNSIWVQTMDVSSFSINLTDYEFDVEDNKSALNWFVRGLDSKIATVEGENSTEKILTFYPQGRGTDTFLLILIDSEGGIDNLTLTLTINPSLGRILALVIPLAVGGAVACILIFFWKRHKAYRDRYLKALEIIQKGESLKK